MSSRPPGCLRQYVGGIPIFSGASKIDMTSTVVVSSLPDAIHDRDYVGLQEPINMDVSLVVLDIAPH